MATQIPAALRPVITDFVQEHDAILNTPLGHERLAALSDFRAFVRNPNLLPEPTEFDVAARSTLDWIGQLPSAITDHRDAPLVMVRTLSNDDAASALKDGFEVLTAGAVALFHAPEPRDPAGIDAISEAAFHVAFGDDDAARKLRGPILDPEFPWPPTNPPIDVARINLVVLKGAFANFYRVLGTCGTVA